MNNDDSLHWIADLPEPGPDAAFTAALGERVRAAARARQRAAWVRRSITAGLAAAACVTLALLLFLPGGGVSPDSGTSFAAVQQHLQSARRYAMTSRIDLEQGGVTLAISRAESWIDQDLGVCTDVELLGRPMVQVWLPRWGRPLLVDHLHRVNVPVELPPTLDPADLLRLDPTTLVRRLAEYAGDVQPVAEAGGPDATPGATRFHVNGGALQLSPWSRIDVWVDDATRLPTRIVARVPLRGGRAIVWTADGFDWDAASGIAEAPMPPSDYETIAPLVVPEPGEEALVRLLESYAHLRGGAFPSEQMPGWDALAHVLATVTRPTAEWKALPEPLRTEAAQRRMLGDAIAGGLFLLHLGESGADPRYVGDVRLGDAAELMRYRLPDGGERIIRGDLTTETKQ